MKKIIIGILVLALMGPAFSSPAIAAQDEVTIVDFGNKICPVMGGPVSEGQYVIYEGVRYGLCCPGCKETFLKDPEKYIAKLKGGS